MSAPAKPSGSESTVRRAGANAEAYHIGTGSRDFLPLPAPKKADGSPRRVGVEIEFGGLSEREVARLAETHLEGQAFPDGARAWRVTGSRVGDIEIVLDTMFREDDPSRPRRLLLDLLSGVVPVEIVTEPLLPSELPALDSFCSVLAKNGAIGSRAGLLLGFGVHFNVEVPSRTSRAIVPVLRAYGLLEAWMRETDPIDLSRRILPFVEPYDASFVDRLAAVDDTWPLADLMTEYVEANPSRNRGLDLLPLLRSIDESWLLAALGEGARAVKARPTWHYRLPDSRVGEEGWSLAYEWNRWRLVEHVAADAALLENLAAGWQELRRSGSGDWSARTGAILAAHLEKRVPE